MVDLAVWDVRGPVRTLRSETSLWDSGAAAWTEPRGFSIVTFRRDGEVGAREFHNPDGSVAYFSREFDERARVIEERSWSNRDAGRKTVYEYDAAGRQAATFHVTPEGERRQIETFGYGVGGRTKTVDLTEVPVDCHCVDGTRVAYGAEGAVSATTAYDDGGSPAAVSFHNAAGGVVQRLVFTRDGNGRPLTEVTIFEGEGPLRDLREIPSVPADEMSRARTLFAVAFPDRILSAIAYFYDREGRLEEKTDRMGALSEERTWYQYDGHGNRVSEVTVSRSRELAANEDGTSRMTESEPRTARHRYEYRYDARGNWTERIASSLMESGRGDYRSTAIERREISYYE